MQHAVFYVLQPLRLLVSMLLFLQPQLIFLIRLHGAVLPLAFASRQLLLQLAVEPVHLKLFVFRVTRLSATVPAKDALLLVFASPR